MLETEFPRRTLLETVRKVPTGSELKPQKATKRLEEALFRCSGSQKGGSGGCSTPFSDSLRRGLPGNSEGKKEPGSRAAPARHILRGGSSIQPHQDEDQHDQDRYSYNQLCKIAHLDGLLPSAFLPGYCRGPSGTPARSVHTVSIHQIPRTGLLRKRGGFTP